MFFKLCCRLLLLVTVILPVTIYAATDCPPLSGEEAAARLENLTAEVLYHNRLYYQELRPVLSDTEYDHLFRKLVKLEECFPLQVRSESPTRRVAAEQIEPKLTIAHREPMLSLDSADDDEAVAGLLQRVSRIREEPVRYLLQPKVDGLPVELHYAGGRLLSAATRGDGLRGEDVTSQVRRMRSIPQQLPKDAPPRVVIRGEIYARKVRPEMEAVKGDAAPYATLRHQAVSTLRQSAATNEALALLELFPFSLLTPIEGLTSDRQALALLKEWGFSDPLPLTWSATSLDEVQSLFSSALANRSAWPFAADGIVVKVDDLALRQILGSGSRSPHWAAAWKFPAATIETVVSAIEWQVGRTGRRTPVATLEAKVLAGIEIEHVTLHNAAELEGLDLLPGDTVLVALVGDVIPQIVAVTKRISRANRPSLAIAAAGSADGCYRLSAGCETQFLRRATYFASTEGLNIAGLGRGRLQQLIDAGVMTDLPSLLQLRAAELGAIDGFGAVSAARMEAALQDALHSQPWRLLAALGVEHVGPKTIERLQESYGTLGALVTVTVDELTPLVGVRAATGLTDFFRRGEGRRQLAAFAELGLCGDDPLLLAWLKRGERE